MRITGVPGDGREPDVDTAPAPDHPPKALLVNGAA